MVVDIRVSWPSAASLDYRLQTDNSPKMKLRLDRFAMMLMLKDDKPPCSLTMMATLRVEVLGLSSGRPLVKGFSAALLEVCRITLFPIDLDCVWCRPHISDGTCRGLVPLSPTATTSRTSCQT